MVQEIMDAFVALITPILEGLPEIVLQIMSFILGLFTDFL